MRCPKCRHQFTMKELSELAKELGKKGGSATTAAKIAAAKANGAKGGRPRKNPLAPAAKKKLPKNISK